MKTIHITFTKAPASYQVVLKYRIDSQPETITRIGDPEPFLLGDGKPPSCLSPLDGLQKKVEWQAARAGATMAIQDKGGKVIEWRDELGNIPENGI